MMGMVETGRQVKPCALVYLRPCLPVSHLHGSCHLDGKGTMKRMYAVALVLVALLLAACAPVGSDAASSAEQALTPIKLGVGFIPSVQFAPFYVGKDKGFFAEQGLELSLDHGFENDYLKLVGTGETQFMVGSGDQVVLGRAQGLPVRYVMNWYSAYPVVVFSRQEAGLTEPAQLKGKRVGIPGPFGASYVALRGILEAGGLTEQDIQMESIGFTQAAAISQGTVDAAVDYAVNGPVVLAQSGIETSQIALDDYLKVPANGLITNEQTIAQQPDLVKNFVTATRKSIQYTLDHPDEAFEIALKFVPEAGGDNLTANRAVFDASLPYWTPPSGEMPGATRLEDWQSAAEFIQRIGLTDKITPAQEMFTNEFASP